jgi:hypothetical protein
MQTQSETMAVELADIDRTKLILSDKLTKKWSWMQDGKMNSGSRDYAEVYYGNTGEKLVIILNDLRTPMGIQTSVKYKTGFMSFKLTTEQSTEIRQKIDEQLFKLVFDKRVSHMKGKGARIQHPSEMRMMFQGLVKDGDPKAEGSAECWPDQITCTVPTKKKGQQVVLDENVCVVEDLDGKPYSWMALDGKLMKEVAIEISEIRIDKEICVKTKIRLLVPDAKTIPRVMTKRKLQQRLEAGGQAAEEPVVQAYSATEPDEAKATVLEPPTKKSRTLPGAPA